MLISEIFKSVQGEGLFTGVPSIFIRFFGCNLTCSGYGMPKGQSSEERSKVNPDNYEKYEDLPLVHTGCDSYASWDPRFKRFSKNYTVTDVVAVIKDLLKDYDGSARRNFHVIFTGGEPLLKGQQKNIVELIHEIESSLGIYNFTFETNGTQVLTDELSKLIMYSLSTFTFSISSKLPSSGHNFSESVNPEAIYEYIASYNTRDVYYGDWMYFKWVVSSEDDISDVSTMVKLYESHNIHNIPVYLMPAGGTVESYQKNEKMVLDLCLKYGFRFSQRLQVPMFKNAWGT